jgi:hypothetical protein
MRLSRSCKGCLAEGWGIKVKVRGIWKENRFKGHSCLREIASGAALSLRITRRSMGRPVSQGKTT